jgi:hypothetical protein
MQTHVFALENLVTVLLVASSHQHLELARDMAQFIATRSGFTPHHLARDATGKMLDLLQAAEDLRSLCAVYGPSGKALDPLL